MNISDTRIAATKIFEHALEAVDARIAVQRLIKLEGTQLFIGERAFDASAKKIYAIAIGKAAPAMAFGLAEILGPHLAAGVLTGPKLDLLSNLSASQWEIFFGGHPLPNEQSLAAAQAAFALLNKANDERALVIFLISGGGSAMIEWPRSGDITLADLRDTNRVLVSCGASIAEINSVRAVISDVKAGGLARRVPYWKLETLIVSDTNEGDDETVASGPTLIRSASRFDAREVVARYHLESSLPHPVLQLLDSSAHRNRGKEKGRNSYYVVLNNQHAILAAAIKSAEFGFAIEIATDIQEQPIAEGCHLLVNRAAEMFERKGGNQPVCLISGGEFSCPVMGDGVGGRNSETVLRCALEISDRHFAGDPGFVILSAGTDGIDGNSPAAGALADSTTIARALALDLDPRDFLERSDAFTFFDVLGDAVTTGATGTNVRDLRIALITPANRNLKLNSS